MQSYKSDKTKRLTMTAMLLAAAFILSWVERAIDIPMIVPGIKLGLANIVIMFTMLPVAKRGFYGACGQTYFKCFIVR